MPKTLTICRLLFLELLIIEDDVWVEKAMIQQLPRLSCAIIWILALLCWLG